MADSFGHGPEALGRDHCAGVVFAERETGPLVMDLVLPPADERRERRVPVVVWLHGGGWFTGDRSMAPDPGRTLIARGIAMASIEYRLSGQATFPAQLHDVRSAIRFLRSRADRFGLDPEAIGLWGSSAGGHLAALAGVCGHRAALPGETGSDASDARVQAVCDGYGPVDLHLAVAEAGHGIPSLSGADAPEARLIGGHPAQMPERARAACPLTYVTGEAPPFLIAHGTDDVLVRPKHSVMLHEALQGTGVDSVLYLVDGYRHGFLNPAGTVEVDGPKLMDDGRLESDRHAAATRYDSTPVDRSPGERTTFSFDTIGGFFHHHLQQKGRA
ncbi:alpha/beta hydrolase [Nocardiopsis chromatogenes]|uniref:alpha/beta hydrolase n=1 Tax=Nocardiopsis chromatogenes TaxID=280239 RepID=UPI00034621CD|nr:alpha/beta hydrolase [Nocardiopsis chromatogenes]